MVKLEDVDYPEVEDRKGVIFIAHTFTVLSSPCYSHARVVLAKVKIFGTYRD